MSTGDFFSSSDLAELRAVGESAMGSMGTIVRRVEVANGMGGYSESYPAVGTVACHIWRTKEVNEQVAGARVISFAEWFIAVPVGTDIRETTDWLVSGETTYQIVHVPTGTTWNPHLRTEAITSNRELREDGV